VSSIAFGNGLKAAYTLDTDYRITRVRVGPASDPGATLDRSLSWTGETINSITDNLFPGTTPPGDYTAQTQSFTYTPTRRLKMATGYYGALSWTYDGNANRASQTLNGVTSTYAFLATSNRLASVMPAGGSARSFTHDAAGNVKTDTRLGALGMSFEYDVEGRLSKARRLEATHAIINTITWISPYAGKFLSGEGRGRERDVTKPRPPDMQHASRGIPFRHSTLGTTDMALLDVQGFLREGGGSTRPFEARVSEPEVTPEGDYFCRVRIHPLLSGEKRIHGVDREQAARLAIEFVRQIVAGKEVIDANSTNIQF
jgi:hypothetical protein